MKKLLLIAVIAALVSCNSGDGDDEIIEKITKKEKEADSLKKLAVIENKK